MSAFIFRTTFKATGDQQKDAITQIEVMQEQAVKAFVSWMTNQEGTEFLSTIRLERERFFIVGSVDSLVWHGNPSVCTVSLTRNPVGIANDISRKILANALDEIELLREHESALQEKQDKVRIIKGMLSQLLSISPWYGALTGFNADNGLAGKILQNGDDYEMVIRGLNVDQLIKVAGFIKKL